MNLAWAKEWMSEFSAAGMEKVLARYADNVQFEDVTFAHKCNGIAELKKFGSSRKSVGKSGGSISLKGAWMLGCRTFERHGNLAWCSDAYLIEAKASCRRVPISRFPAAGDATGRLR